MLGKILGLVGAAVFVAATVAEVTERLARRGKKRRREGEATPGDARSVHASADDAGDGRAHGE